MPSGSLERCDLFDAHLYQRADAVLIDHLERIVRDVVVLFVVVDESAVVVAAHAQRRLGQVVGAESDRMDHTRSLFA